MNVILVSWWMNMVKIIDYLILLTHESREIFIQFQLFCLQINVSIFSETIEFTKCNVPPYEIRHFKYFESKLGSYWTFKRQVNIFLPFKIFCTIYWNFFYTMLSLYILFWINSTEIMIYILFNTKYSKIQLLDNSKFVVNYEVWSVFVCFYVFN